MPSQLALLLTIAFIFWLLAGDLKRRRHVSHALWIPLLWLVVIGSRSVSWWFGVQVTGDPQLDGSPLDRLVFLFLIVAGMLVLLRRGVAWSSVVSNNKWLFIYFLYLGITVLWSDYPFVAFKRWIKDVGNIIMVLVILSESHPIEAVKTVFLRCAYILVPLSVLFIRYFPDIGRYYNPWSWTYSYGGVTTNKNELGATLVVYGIVVLWEVLELYADKSQPKCRAAKPSCLIVLVMIAWLFSMAQSATSLLCTLLGACLLLGMRLPTISRRIEHVEIYAGGLIVACVFLNSLFNVGAVFTRAVDRDMTLTDRTVIWERLLQADINPVIGTGYYSFWLNNERVEKASEGFYYHLNEAHNGYIETYLNTGFIGLLVLLVLLVAALRSTKRRLLAGVDNYGSVQFAVLAITAVYNITEAAFNRLDFIWFAFLVVLLNYSRVPGCIVNDMDDGVPSVAVEHAPVGESRHSPEEVSVPC